MTTTPRDKTDTKTRRAPRQRTAADEPKGYAKARAELEERAQTWLRGRPARTMCVPEDVAQLVAAVGVPGASCGALIYRDRDAGHTVVVTAQPSWFAEGSRSADRHWAAAITVDCPAACRR